MEKNIGQNNNPNLPVIVDFATWLQREFTGRCKRNPKYSLRAFANFLEIDASSLSQFMSKKRKASTKMKDRIGRKLGATKNQLEAFSNPDADYGYDELEADKFHFISDWYHIAIMELSCTDDFDPKPRSIAKRLGITTDEARAAIERLKRLNLIFETNNSFVKSSKNISNFKPGQTSQAHKSYQKQILEKAIDAIEECPPELKDITSISMAIDVDKIPKARKLIANFRQKLCDFMEEDSQEEVYNLSIQLHPITKVRIKK